MNLANNVLVLLLIIFNVSACSAPTPAKISFTSKMRPINLNEEVANNNIIIKSSQKQNRWNKQFAYSIDEGQEYSPQFFYAIAHADKITVFITPLFVDFVFSKVQSNLRSYGVTAPIELVIEEDNKQASQVILECIKYKSKKS